MQVTNSIIIDLLLKDLGHFMYVIHSDEEDSTLQSWSSPAGLTENHKYDSTPSPHTEPPPASIKRLS